MNTTITRHPAAIAAAVLAVAAAITAALLLGGGSGARLGPAEALAQAADETAGVGSGVARATMAVPGGEDYSVELRYDGANSEIAFDELLEDGSTRPRVIRVVDGVGYSRRPDGTWEIVEGDPGDLAALVEGDVGNRELFEAVKEAEGVSGEDGVYRATLTAEQTGGLSSPLLGISPDAPLVDAVPVEVEAGSDGLIRRISVDAGGARRTVTYSELGEPQAIEAPPVAAP